MKKTNIFRKFESIKSFTDYLDNGTTQPAFKRHESSKNGTSSFTGTVSYADANNRLLYGDRELMEKIYASGVYETEAKINKYTNKRQLTAAYVGFAPHVPNYVSGVPNNMIRQIATRVKQPILTIGYNTAVMGRVNADDIIKACAEMVSAIIILEAKGYRVNFYTLDHDTTDDGTVSYAIRIKTSSQKMDVLKMAYPMAHPSMNRRHKFRFTEVTEGVPESFVWGYGCPTYNEDKMKKHFAANGMVFDTIFSYDSLEGKTASDIIEYICGKK